MNRLLLALSIIIYCTTVYAQDTLRIASYNIRNGHGIDNICNYSRTAEVLNKLNAHFIAIQEVDSVTRRSNGVFVADTLATLCNKKAHYGAAIDYKGGKYGVAILSCEEPITTQNIPLPGREERRTLFIAEYKKFFLACTHLSLTDDDRLASLSIIDSIAGKSKKPFIIAGDFNDHPQSELIKLMLVNWELLSSYELPTFPADLPTYTIDYIAIHRKNSQCIQHIGASVADEPHASDHRPIVTTIILK